MTNPGDEFHPVRYLSIYSIIFQSIYLSIYSKKSKILTNPGDEFHPVRYLSIYISVYLSIYYISVYLSSLSKKSKLLTNPGDEFHPVRYLSIIFQSIYLSILSSKVSIYHSNNLIYLYPHKIALFIYKAIGYWLVTYLR